jgi:hypothetical protein
MTKISFTPPVFKDYFDRNIKFNVPLGATTVTKYVPVLDHGPLEVTLQWLLSLNDICTLMNYDAATKYNATGLVLSGVAHDNWIEAVNQTLGALNPTDNRYRATMTLFLTKQGALPRTTEDLRNMLLRAHKPNNMCITDFKNRLETLNRYLPLLPAPMNNMLDQAQLFSIIKNSVPAWESTFETTNQAATIDTTQALAHFYEALENDKKKKAACKSHNNRAHSNSHPGCGGRGHGRGGRSQRSDSNTNNNSGKWCRFHQTNTHNTSECRAAQAAGNSQGRGGRGNGNGRSYNNNNNNNNNQ